MIDFSCVCLFLMNVLLCTQFLGCLDIDYFEYTFSFVICPFLVSQSLLPDYQRLLSSMPSRRLNSSKLIENSGEFFLLTLGYIWLVALKSVAFLGVLYADCFMRDSSH